MNNLSLKIEFFIKNRLFSKESIYFAIIPLLYANIIYILASYYYSSPRNVFIFLTAFVCITGLFLNRFVFLFLLFVAIYLDAAVFVSNFFQIPLPMLLDSLQFLLELSLTQSLTYMAVLGLLLVTLLMTYRSVIGLKKSRDRISLFPVLIVAIIAGAADFLINSPPKDVMQLKLQLAETFEPIEDAASFKTGFAQFAKTTEHRDLLIVMVEGLGAFSSRAYQDIVWGPLLGAPIREKYAVTQGTALYFGSTTSGEARELCNLKADYRDFRDKDMTDCLPHRALAAGYKTAAFHAFTERFFERNDWFPKIGFQELYFLEERVGLKADKDLPWCGMTFKGLCDSDVARSVEAYLTSDEHLPRFVYWLTLNSHKPVMPGEVPERLACDDGGVFGDVELCRMSEQWLNISHLVQEIALNEKLKKTEILLVGDHHPPLFTRKARHLFQPAQVAWLHLAPLDTPPADRLAAAKSGPGL
ncbi:MAG: sulfatase-like hydrolase/transferase [Roseibium sp.]|uniref:sulfatase-like hydrolase/transferase n=1 Tax=Roseibium sp. TaxID=1936156 RepID=UPI003D9C56ED